MFAISLITEDNTRIRMLWPNLCHLSDTDHSNPGVTHSVTQEYYSFFLWLFDLFPGHDLPCFLHPYVLPLRASFFVLSNLAPSFHTSPFQLFLGFPAGLFPPRLPSRIRFGILLSNTLTTCPAQRSLSTCIYQSYAFIPFLHFFRRHYPALVPIFSE
jgi:hypothetical protein